LCTTLKEEGAREREIKTLETAMEELKLEQGTIITLYEKERIKTPAGIIDVIPAWEWCLA
jgi:predicted AAA+ superfamily ATPase